MKINKIIFVALLAMVFAACDSIKQMGIGEKTEMPTEVLKKFVEASMKKDPEAIKQTLSSGTLKMIQESAQKQNTTVEELLKKDDPTALKEMPETRNETVEGDTATVEVKNKAGDDWDKIPFVKEEGKWKIALDKFMQDLMKMNDDMKSSNTKTMPMDTVNSNTANSPAANSKP
ncbi:MAG: nuclear transport factor 2 family protein [Pyrinomonadaceae bacterium]